MYYIAILFEHIDLLNRLDRLHIELLQRRLQLLVVGTGGLVDLFGLSPWCAFAAATVSSLALTLKSWRRTLLEVSTEPQATCKSGAGRTNSVLRSLCLQLLQFLLIHDCNFKPPADSQRSCW